MCKVPKKETQPTRTQLQEITDELAEVQTYCNEMSRAYGTDPMAIKFTRWANSLGTTRVLLEVFADEWTEALARSVNPGKSPMDPRTKPDEHPDVTSANCNDFDDMDGL